MGTSKSAGVALDVDWHRCGLWTARYSIATWRLRGLSLVPSTVFILYSRDLAASRSRLRCELLPFSRACCAALVGVLDATMAGASSHDEASNSLVCSLQTLSNPQTWSPPRLSHLIGCTRVVKSNSTELHCSPG